ncbi:MAG: replication factor large subunit [Firmicutes bacterium]|nr:replication factor large subunit [Bacillota bacterium]
MNDSTKLSQLVLYRNLLADPLVYKLHLLLTSNAEPDLEYELAAGLIEAAERLGLDGNLWQSYLIHCIASDENTFTLAVEKSHGQIGQSIREAAIHDIAILLTILKAQPLPACHNLVENFSPTKPTGTAAITMLREFIFSSTPTVTPNELIDKLIEYYIHYGSGPTAGFKAFRWNDKTGLVGIVHPDAIKLDDIIGYESQKATLVQNTEAFIAGRPANNILLAGARGTGKSSSVKALINRYHTDGLRLVEVPKHQLSQLNIIIDRLRNRSQKFIIFLDDLSFEEAESDYKYLKSIIDGGIEARPANVLLYATSNRRHLIRESWADRADVQDIHSADTVQEKISLADRFGITLTFSAPNQDEFLQIVEGIAKRNDISLPAAELKSAAIRWEMSRSGRSGRVAKQFVTHLLSNNKN